MPIEIRELHIKVKIEENAQASQPNAALSAADYEALKSKLVKECTAKVLAKIKEREER